MKSKIGVIFLVSVLALAGIGIGYAGWTDSIAISGSVSTGHVDLNLVKYSGTWVWKDIPNHGIDRNEGFSIGTAYDVDPEGHYNDANWMLVGHAWAAPTVGADDTVTLTYDNLFPCQDFCTDFVLSYSGIPVRVQGPIMIGTSNILPLEAENFKGNTGVDWLEYLYTYPHAGAVPAETGPGGITITAYFCDANGVVPANPVPVTVGTQLHDGDYVYVKVCIHIPQDNAYMSLSGSFSTTLDVIQWDHDYHI